MNTNKYIILGGHEWPLKRIEEIEKESDTLQIGEGHRRSKFPIKVIKQFDKVFSPYNFKLGMPTSKGVKHNSLYAESVNPYIPNDKCSYFVSIVVKDGKYGMIDSSGCIILSPIFRKIEIGNSENNPYFIVKKEDCAFLYDVMKFKITSEYYDDIIGVDHRYFHTPTTADGYYEVYKNKKCGLIHESGKEILPTIFDHCYGFRWAINEKCYNDPKLHYAIVTINNKKGLYNELGEEVLPIIYDSMHFYHAGLNAKNIGVKGAIGDEPEKDLIDTGIKFIFIDRDGKGSDGKVYKKIKIDYASNSYKEPHHYNRYNGAYGFSDEEIDTIFDGDPDAYWNID